MTAAEESLAHPSFSSAGARYVHKCSGSLPNVFPVRESSKVRTRQVSHSPWLREDQPIRCTLSPAPGSRETLTKPGRVLRG